MYTNIFLKGRGMNYSMYENRKKTFYISRLSESIRAIIFKFQK